MIDKKTQLAWLDKQRSIVNDMIVNLPPDEQRKLLPELQVINAIAERVKDMTAVEYWEAWQEMFVQKEFGALPATLEQARNPRLAVEIVKKWKEEQGGH